MELGGSLGCSVHELVELSIKQGENDKQDSSMDFRREKLRSPWKNPMGTCPARKRGLRKVGDIQGSIPSG